MDKASFCVTKGGCCPEANFHDDGSVTILDEAIKSRVPFSKDQADKLADELRARGYGTSAPLSEDSA